MYQPAVGVELDPVQLLERLVSTFSALKRHDECHLSSIDELGRDGGVMIEPKTCKWVLLGPVQSFLDSLDFAPETSRTVTRSEQLLDICSFSSALERYKISGPTGCKALKVFSLLGTPFIDKHSFAYGGANPVPPLFQAEAPAAFCGGSGRTKRRQSRCRGRALIPPGVSSCTQRSN